MHEDYDYVLLQAPPDDLSRLRSVFVDDARQSGAVVVGAWLGAGSIGWSDNEAVVLVCWPDGRGEAAGRAGAFVPPPASDVIALKATTRPVEPNPVQPGGVHAHRWMETTPEDIDEVVDLSTQAWPAFEANFEAQVEGLFRTEDDSGRLLLVTWYASVAEWERSRGVARADHGDLAAARHHFQRRRQLTRRQVVRLARESG